MYACTLSRQSIFTGAPNRKTPRSGSPRSTFEREGRDRVGGADPSNEDMATHTLKASRRAICIARSSWLLNLDTSAGVAAQGSPFFSEDSSASPIRCSASVKPIESHASDLPSEKPVKLHVL